MCRTQCCHILYSLRGNKPEYKLKVKENKMQSSSGNHVEKFGKTNKAGREKLNGKRDNKKLNKTVRGRREGEELEAM